MYDYNDQVKEDEMGWGIGGKDRRKETTRKTKTW
jgi:hypothetical protein